MNPQLHDASSGSDARTNTNGLSLMGGVLAGFSLIGLLFVLRLILDQGLITAYIKMRSTEDGLNLTDQAWGLAFWLLVMIGVIAVVFKWLRARGFPVFVDVSVGLAVLVVGVVIGRSMMRLDFQYMIFDGGAIQVMSTWMVIVVLSTPLIAAGLVGWWLRR